MKHIIAGSETTPLRKNAVPLGKYYLPVIETPLLLEEYIPPGSPVFLFAILSPEAPIVRPWYQVLFLRVSKSP